jgi:hypothetical protein
VFDDWDRLASSAPISYLVSDSVSSAQKVHSTLGAGLALLTGWLGGELVERLGVGVDDGAHLNSPNSLSGRPASESAPGVQGEAVQGRRPA